MTCCHTRNAGVTEEMYAETERIRAMIELNNDIALAALAFNEGRTEIVGDMRQRILNVMHENELGHITARQLFALMN